MILVLLITLPIILIYILDKMRKKTEIPLLPPGPPRLPLIGNLHQLGGAGILHLYLFELGKKYGPIIHLKLGSLPLLVISSPKLAKEVLKTQDLAICSRPKLLVPQKLSYDFLDIIFSPYNDHWRDVRKITVTHLFSLAKIQSFRPIREEEVSDMVANVSGFAESNQVVNISELARALSSSLICRVAFGKRYEERAGPEKLRLDELLHQVQTLMATFFVSDYFPAFGWVDKLTGLIGRLDNTCKKLDSFYQELIDEHVDPSRVKEMDGGDFLDVLIQLKQDKTCSVQLSWDHIKALLMNIFIAATESSAATTVWIMTALMKAPKVMNKVKSEIRNVSGKNGKVDEDDLAQLHYLNAVINETLRLYPPAPLLVPRETMQRCIIDGYDIQPKTMVYINAWAIARDPECWENPDEFVPERFLGTNIDIKGQDFGAIPFGSGRRICPGMSMGLVDVKLTVANLICSFDWELPFGIQPHDVDVDVLPGIAMHKKNALLIVPSKCGV